ncbi:hypothetical protein BGW42_003917 [Actinomortierella wolfii]|nr:hypothetical protein BGW42_003917 [Actinomortierella wolfii]
MARFTPLALLITFIGTIAAAPVEEVKIQPVNLTVPAVLNVTYHGAAATLSNDRRNACEGIQYALDEPVVAINKAQFGNGTVACGKYVEVALEDTPDATRLFKVVDVCEDCSKGGLGFSREAMRELTDEDMVKVNWKLIEDPAANATAAATALDKRASKSRREKFHGRMTWFSDTMGSCGHRFSQSDMIVAMNENQMGKMWGKKSRCGQKVRVWNSKTSVVLTIVDTCPKRYCKHGALDLSRAAFKRFAPMSKGVLYLDWEFIN